MTETPNVNDDNGIVQNESLNKVSDYPKNLQNPFVDKLLEKVAIKRKFKAMGSQQPIFNDSNELEGKNIFLKNLQVDEQKFAKLYLSEIYRLWSLSKPAVRVLTYFLNNLNPNKDYVDFWMPLCLKYTKYKTTNKVYIGLADLLKAGIIARGWHDKVYYINPLFAFNGTRIPYIEEKITEKKATRHKVDFQKDSDK